MRVVYETSLRMMKIRDELHKEASETNCRNDWDNFKSIRNKINNRLKFEERAWQKARLEECG